MSPAIPGGRRPGVNSNAGRKRRPEPKQKQPKGSPKDHAEDRATNNTPVIEQPDVDLVAIPDDAKD